MKNNSLFLSAALALSVLFAGCVKDGSEGPDQKDKKTGEVSRMVLTVQSLAPKGAASRAADDFAEEASEEELTIYSAHGLRVIIFDDGGILQKANEYSLSLKSGTAGTEGAVYSTSDDEAIELAAGDYYFFVFANDASDRIAFPDANTTMSTWMADYFELVYSNAGVPDITGSSPNGFLLGTLWKEAVSVEAGATEDAIVEVELPTLGRLSSKVWVKKLNAINATNPALSGTFSDAKYRLGAVALKMSNVGIVTTSGRNNPFESGTIVTSYLHTALYNSPDFKDKAGSTWKDISATDEPTAGGFFYASENTTARSDANLLTDEQFYGNTTHVILELVYTPVAAEILMWDGDEWITGGTLDDTTFWSAGEGENRKIYNENPKNDPDYKLPATGFTEDEIHEYSEGRGYYAFPVNDPDETDPIAKNRVLRNHYYEYTIDGIRDLGAPTEDTAVDDEKPIEENTSVILSVSVGKWDKVTTGQIIL